MAFSFSQLNQSVQPRDHGSRLLLAGERDVVAAVRVAGGDSVSRVLTADRLGNRAMGGGVTASVSIFTLAPEVPAKREAEAVRTVEVKPWATSAMVCKPWECGQIGIDSIGGLNIERGGGTEPRRLFNRRHRHTFADVLLSDSRLFSIDGQRAAGAAFRPSISRTKQGDTEMQVTLNDYAVAKAANNRRIGREIESARQGVAIGYTLLAILGVLFTGYTVVRLWMEVC